MKNKHLSREDINRYRSTNDEGLKRDIEGKSLSDSFSADALDGWSVPEMAHFSMKRLDKHFIRSYKWLALSVGGLLVIGSFIALWLGSEGDGLPKAAFSARGLHSFSTADSIDRIKDVDSTVSIGANKPSAPLNFENNSPDNHHGEPVRKEVEDVNELPLRKLKLYWETYPTNLRAINYKGAEFYLYELKLLDYRVYRVGMKISANDLVLYGTPASVGDKKQPEDALEGDDTGVPYIDYLDRTVSHFSKGDYGISLSRFLVILGDYPDDVNALFYGGLCYYHLGNFKNAALLFDRVGASTYANFKEEAEWYLAKSWLKGNEVEQGKGRSLLNDIIQANGYYAKDAWELLMRL